MAFNPVKRVFETAQRLESDIPMTLQGTLVKIVGLLFVMFAAALGGWWSSAPENSGFLVLVPVAFIGGIILGIVSALWPRSSQYTAIPYALCQGFLMGTVTSFFEIKYPGIALLAVSSTLATAIAMVLLYKLEIIKVTETVKAVIISATGGIAVTYLIVFVLGLFGFRTGSFLQSTSMLSIAFNLFVVAVAAFNLLLDFSLIEEGAEHELPHYMEWYGAFNVLVTLIWLYFEILNLLRKIARR